MFHTEKVIYVLFGFCDANGEANQILSELGTAEQSPQDKQIP
jgi:hypothetical protein